MREVHSILTPGPTFSKYAVRPLLGYGTGILPLEFCNWNVPADLSTGSQAVGVPRDCDTADPLTRAGEKRIWSFRFSLSSKSLPGNTPTLIHLS